MSSESISQIIKTLFQTGYINNFIFHGVFFNRYVQLKNSFSDKKTLEAKYETHFIREAFIREYSILGRSWQSTELFKMQNYTDNANGSLHLTVQNA